MDISYDPAKERRNVATRGLSFELVHFFDWESAVTVEDVRKDYGERRYRSTGTLEKRLYVVVFTLRSGRLHVISLRKANQRELRRHEEKIIKTKAGSGNDR